MSTMGATERGTQLGQQKIYWYGYSSGNHLSGGPDSTGKLVRKGPVPPGYELLQPHGPNDVLLKGAEQWFLRSTTTMTLGFTRPRRKLSRLRKPASVLSWSAARRNWARSPSSGLPTAWSKS